MLLELEAQFGVPTSYTAVIEEIMTFVVDVSVLAYSMNVDYSQYNY
jgi:hypothetical protein